MHLSDEEKAAVVSSWSDVAENHLEDVLLQLVRENSELRSSFSWGNLPEDCLREDDKFKEDVKRLNTCISKVVDILSSSGDAPLACPVSSFTSCPYLKSVDMPLFIKCFNSGNKFSENAKSGWRAIFEMAGKKMSGSS